MAKLVEPRRSTGPAWLPGGGRAAVLLLDAQGVVVGLARGTEHLPWGNHPDGGPVGLPAASVLPIRDPEAFQRTLMQAVVHGSHRQAIWTGGADGSSHRTELAIRTLVGGTGTVTGFVLAVAGPPVPHSETLKEMEEALEAEHLLAEAGEVFAASLDLEETARWITRVVTDGLGDWGLLCLARPERSCTLVGTASVAAEDDDLAIRLQGARPAAERSPLARVLETGRPELAPRAPPHSFRFSPADGSEAVEVPARSYVAVPLEGNRMRGVLALVSTDPAHVYTDHDVELLTLLAHRTSQALDRADLYDEARRAVVIRDEVLGMVSHDLGTPVASISMLVDRLLRRPADTDRRIQTRHYLESMRGSVARMGRMIDDLLDVQRIETSQFQLVLSPGTLHEIVAAAVEEVAPPAAERRVDVILDPPCCPIRVEADRDRLVQLLCNLLTNAVRFSAAEGEVRVHSRCRGPLAEIAVTDHGPGIAPERLSHIFDRFSQTSQPDPAGRAGLGLGLTIAKRIAEAHNGRLEVDSEVGRGSTFRLLVPRLPLEGEEDFPS